MAVAGCTGQLGDNGEGPGPGTPSGEDPGRVTIHRLNRAEYDNTIRDLTSVSIRPAADFPNDDHGYGFDNIADVLSIAPALVEKYDLAAEAVLTEALAAPADTTPRMQRFEAETAQQTTGAADGDFWNLWTDGEISQTFTVELAGDYDLSAIAYQQAAGPDPARMELIIDGRVVTVFDVTASATSPGTYEARVALTPGPHTLTVGFTNDFYEAPADRNLLVDALGVEGPFDAVVPPSNSAAWTKIMVCDPAASDVDTCAREIIGTFAKRAWRRPPTTDELDRLKALFDVPIAEGDPFVKGVELALHAVLLSPSFLFRVELDPEPTSTTPHALTTHELASRLSYFLWSSMPDDALFAKADDGTLESRASSRARCAACSATSARSPSSTTSPASGSTRAPSMTSAPTPPRTPVG
jgi:hypothetical protein